MVNYANGKVYKIEPICEHNDADVYFGSTTKQYLSQRMDQHRSNFNRKAGMCSSKILFEKYGVENCVIILLESVNATTNDELRAVEAKYIVTNACVNKNIPLRTQKEWISDNTEKNKEYMRQYYIDNLDTIQEQQKKYYIDNLDTIQEQQKQYRNDNADKNRDKINERNRQYRLKQKEQKKTNAEYYKEYAIKNRDTINEKQRQRRLKQKEQANAEN